MLKLVGLIPLFPLLGFLINGIANKRMPKAWVGIIGSASIFFSFLISLGIFLSTPNGEVNTFDLFSWINVAGLQIPFSFLVDPLSMIMLLIITGVGFLIHVYSIGYMHHDEGFARYFAYLNLFVFFMLLLVLGSNYAIMFIGWEGVGLCSYLLIGFWFKNTAYNNAAKKAFIMNRIGDLGFLLGLFLIYTTFGTVNYKSVMVQAAGFNTDGYGNKVVINHGYGYQTLYGHMVRVKARVGQRVKRGEVIGYIGSTGKSTGPHCHYEVIKRGTKVDPVYYFFNDLTPAQFDRLLKEAAANKQSLD